MHFESPLAFLLLLLLPVVLWPRRRRSGSLRFSSTGTAARTAHSWRQRLSFTPGLLRGLAFILLVIALARPQTGLERIRDINSGIAIEMVLDRSSSMSAELEFRGEVLNRLEVAKRVFRDFVMGDERGLEGRPNDLVGMVAFARYADTVCPLTLAHGALEPFLESVELVTRRNEDGTAIGDALALAAARLKTAEETLAEQAGGGAGPKDYEIKSKIVILMTDGESNAGKRDPLSAADLAAEWGIKVYTIGIGGGDSMTTVQTLFGNFKSRLGARFDDTALKAIAEKTGGLYRRADSAKALQSIYREIDQLEKSEIESIRFMDYSEHFTPYALMALALLLAAELLGGTLFRKIP
jgi:Ca-activated chloride channel family protein